MNYNEELKNFITRYMIMRKAQNEYFKFRSTSQLKKCKALESQLDQMALQLMIDLGIEFQNVIEQLKLL